MAFGAHYDHVGYADGETERRRKPAPARRAGSRRAPRRSHLERRGRRRVGDGGADGAGAKAFAQGRGRSDRCCSSGTPARSAACWGSRYFADYPTVPIDRIVAQLNIDMIGRNRDDKASEANTVYLVGSDRISTELHEISRAANPALAAAADARLRDERPGRSRAALLPQRPLQLRGEGHPDHLLHDGAASATTTRTPTRCRRSSSTR